MPLLLLLSAPACVDRPVDRSTDITGNTGDTPSSSASDGLGWDASSAGADPTGEDTSVPSCASAPCGPLNCGPNGTPCGDIWGLTECIDGECGPRFGGCFWGVGTPPKTCSEICGIEDDEGVCVADACRGTTAYGWPEEYEQACSTATPGAMVALDVGCNDLIDFSDPRSQIVQCCCDFPGN